MSVGVYYHLTNEYKLESQRQDKIINATLKDIQEIEDKRLKVLTDYLEDLSSYETKSIYHQIYHANNAQLRLMNLIVQENQLLITLIAKRKGK
jgi:peptide methionine sulfoxide reductase MsrA